MSELQRWQVKYTAIPTAYNRSANAIIEAETADDARALLRAALGDGNGVQNYVIETPQPYAPPTIKGRIVTMYDGRKGDE